MPGLNLDLVRHALNTAQEHGFSEVDLTAGEASFRATLEPSPKPKPPQPRVQTSHSPVDSELPAIKSPLVGYYRIGPTALEAGKSVRKGDVIAVINALGIANDIESPLSGEIIEVLVKDGQGVEFGQVLAKVKA